MSRARVETLVREGRAGARALAAVVADRPRHVNLLLLLRLVAETAATVLLTVALARLITPVWAGILTAGAIMVVVSYVFIGVGPRTLGRQHPYELGVAIAAPVRALATLLGPLTRLLILIGNALTPGKGFRQGPFSSEVELRELVDMASTSGVVDETERKMIHSVFELGDTLVREVMVPRPDVVWVERDTPSTRCCGWPCAAATPGCRCSGRTSTTSSASPTSRTWSGAQAEQAQTATGRRLDRRHAPRGVRPRQQADRRAAQGDAAHPQPHGDRRRRVRRHRRRRDDRGHPRGDRRGDHRRVRRRGGARRRPAGRRPAAGRGPAAGRRPAGARRPVPRRPTTSDEGPGAQLRAVLEDADVDTVGGLLAQQLGRVPLPGAEVEVAGLHLLAEGGKDARGRVRITTVLITPVHGRDGEANRRAADVACSVGPIDERVPASYRTAAPRAARETTPPARTPDGGRMTMSGAAELDPEDAKIVTLARSARARTGAAEGAAVRDTDGRTYVAASVALPSLSLTALQAAVAAAVSSGAPAWRRPRS